MGAPNPTLGISLICVKKTFIGLNPLWGTTSSIL